MIAVRRSAAAQAGGLGLGPCARQMTPAVAVLLEDSAAVLGVVIAFVCAARGAHHQPWWTRSIDRDRVLLGAVAMFLTSIDVDWSVDLGKDQAYWKLEDPAVEHVVVARGEVAGADAYRISAEIELDGHHLARLWLDGRDQESVLAQVADAASMPAFLGEFADDIVEMVGDEVDRIEERIREAIPRAQSVDLEPD